MSRVFISYARNDGSEIAREIEEKLQLHNLNPWRDVKNITGGYPWNSEIDDAIADSYAMIVIATDEAVKSVGVTYEWATALALKNVRVILVFFRGKRNEIPQQLNTLHQLEWGTIDFWTKLIDDLKIAQTEDQLINIRIPVEADAELKHIAKMAFSSVYSQEENLTAIGKLFDMYNEPIAREILINGLNSRRHTIVNHILLKMKSSGFDDPNAVSALMKLLFLPVKGGDQEQNRSRRLISLSKAILIKMKRECWHILYNYANNTDDFIEKQRIVEVLTIAYPKGAASLLSSWMELKEENTFEITLALLIELVSNYEQSKSNNQEDFTDSGYQDLPGLFEYHILPTLKNVISKKRKALSFRDSSERDTVGRLLLQLETTFGTNPVLKEIKSLL